MIKVNALLFLVLIELLFVLAGTTILFLFRVKKYSALYKSSLKDSKTSLKKPDDVQKQVTENQPPAPQPEGETGDAAAKAPATDVKIHEKCKIELTIVEDKLKEKNKLLNDLQVKFDALEKEYLILYRQQQKQQDNSGQPEPAAATEK